MCGLTAANRDYESDVLCLTPIHDTNECVPRRLKRIHEIDVYLLL